MPWIAIRDGERVAPEYVEDGTTVECPECEGPMSARGPFVDGTPRHFWHTGNVGGGSGGDGSCITTGGESDTHKKLKSFALSKLRNIFDDDYDTATPEYPIGNDSNLPSGADERQADAFLRFKQQHDRLGNGIVVEVQYRNESKDKGAVEEDFLSHGYSVLWLDEDDFSADECLLDREMILERVVSVWPNAAPPTEPGSMHWDREYIDMESFRKLHARWARHSRLPRVVDVKAGSPVLDEVGPLSSFFDAEVAFLNEVEFDDPIIQATLPSEWVDEMNLKIWRDQAWDELFPGREESQALEDVEPGEWSLQTSVPFDSFFKEMPQNRETARYRKSLKINWRVGHSKYKRQKEKELEQSSSDPTRPPNPFNDVQCRNCGTYWNYQKEYDVCPDCGIEVDFDWNIATDRINQCHVPPL